MRTEFEKYMKIASELLSYCHIHNAAEFHLDIVQKEDATYFAIHATPAKITDSEMEHLVKRLQAPRRREMEQNYWALGGRSEETSELHLIGMMVDDAIIDYHDDSITINLKRLI